MGANIERNGPGVLAVPVDSGEGGVDSQRAAILATCRAYRHAYSLSGRIFSGTDTHCGICGLKAPAQMPYPFSAGCRKSGIVSFEMLPSFSQSLTFRSMSVAP